MAMGRMSRHGSRAEGRAWLVAVVGVLAAGLLGALLIQGGAADDPGTPSPGRVGDDAGARAEPDGVPALPDAPAGLTGAGRDEGTTEEVARPAGPLKVRAVDAWSGAPVRIFHVVSMGFGELGSGVLARSDRDTGVAGVPRAEASAPLGVRAAGYRPAEFLLEPGFPVAEHTVRLERSASVVGTVRDGASAPLASAAVHLEFLGSDPAAIPPGAEPVAFAGPTLRRTRADGTYAFTDLPSGAYRTRVEVAGASVRSDRVIVVPGEWRTVDHWLDEHTRLSVTVLTPEGGPSARTRVLLFREDEEEEPAAARYTGEGGTATLGPLAEGTYSLRIVSDHGHADPTSVLVSADGSSNMSRTVRLAESPR